jgi:prepilin-type N-terminal cleavage/methylation domain-containing protein
MPLAMTFLRTGLICGRPRIALPEDFAVQVTTSSERGFTLLETTVALLILAYALTGLAALTSSNVRTNAQARYYSAAGALAQQKMEDLRAVGYTAAASSTSAESLTEIGATSGTTLFTRTWTVANGATSGTKTLSATVAWSDMHGAHQVQLQSLLAQ